MKLEILEDTQKNKRNSSVRIKSIFKIISISFLLIILTNYNEELNDQDGNVYRTVQIGNQRRMTENPRVTPYQNGAPIPNVASSI